LGNCLEGEDVFVRLLDLLIALAALVGLVFIGWWSVYQSPHNAAVLESNLQDAVSERLAATGNDWATAKVEGQRAIIAGAAPSEDAFNQISDVALTAAGEGGLIFGGITVVLDASSAAPPISPYVWRATKTADGRIILTGHVPTEAIRAGILADAEAIAPGKVDDRLAMGSGVPEGNWQGIARVGLKQLGLMEAGTAMMSDRHLSVDGVAMNDAARAEAIADVANVAAPYTSSTEITGASLWAANHGEAKLVLTGRVASETERAEITAIAQKFYAGDVVDEMSIDDLSNEGWIDGVRLGLPHFAKFTSGKMGFEPEGEGFTFAGEASGSTLAYLREDMANLTGPYSVNIKADTVQVEVAEIEGIDFSAAPVAACQAAFDAVLADNKVTFALGKALITRESGETLDKLMAVSSQCDPSLMFELGGHTDNTGSRDGNITLSQARAASVVDYMRSAGFDASRLLAKGYGPDEPAADNATRDGRAANRRIEFKVQERTQVE